MTTLILDTFIYGSKSWQFDKFASVLKNTGASITIEIHCFSEPLESNGLSLRGLTLFLVDIK